jgi:hypothetical protein
LDLTFFGLTLQNVSNFRASLFSEIHEIVFHGNGGYDYSTVYNMPVWLRKFTFNKLQDHYTKQAETQKQQTKSGNTTNVINEDGTINAPEFAKVSKQYNSKDQRVPKY